MYFSEVSKETLDLDLTTYCFTFDDDNCFKRKMFSFVKMLLDQLETNTSD